jgi:hypothetical protein
MKGLVGLFVWRRLGGIRCSLAWLTEQRLIVAAAVVDAEDDGGVVDGGEGNGDAAAKAGCAQSGADVVPQSSAFGERGEALAVGDESIEVAAGDLGGRCR